MATKTKIVGKIKPAAEKVIHGAIMKTNIPAGMASSAPPLGTMLGQRGINITHFVKDFNETTKNIKEGIPLPTRLHINADRSYILEILKPHVSHLLKQASGIKRSSMGSHTIGGVVSLKHCFEIAKFKLQDINCAHMQLKDMCIKVVNTAYRCGIKVVAHDIDPEEMKEFLEKRMSIEKAEKAEIADKKAARLLKLAAAAAAARAEAATKKG